MVASHGCVEVSGSGNGGRRCDGVVWLRSAVAVIWRESVGIRVMCSELDVSGQCRCSRNRGQHCRLGVTVLTIVAEEGATQAYLAFFPRRAQFCATAWEQCIDEGNVRELL